LIGSPNAKAPSNPSEAIYMLLIIGGWSLGFYRIQVSQRAGQKPAYVAIIRKNWVNYVKCCPASTSQ
jgi:hypothetical protein